ncbi:MAG: BatA domain-containing protein [Candidatus Eiseniibacteriota bacterium]|nr:MAG: BatA domain-containing protein [Candidatus Eisenbacteria bacterium]
MSAFFFLNRLFLLGLAAAVIPLLIHLFTRKKARKLSFSSVDFLRDVAQRETRRLRVRNVILLLLRTAVICAFVLAMARPVLRGPLVKGPGTTAAVVVLDNSASMARPKDGRPLFEHARDIARQVFVELSDRDEGAVIPVCGTPESSALVEGSSRLLGAVRFLEPSFSGERPDDALALAASLLKESKSINRELYVISDFQKSQWRQLDTPLESIEGVKTVLVPVSSDYTENLSVEKAEIIPMGAGEKRVLELTASNHGRRLAEGVPVRVMGDGRELAVRYVDVPAGGTASAGLEFEGNFREVTAEIPSDALPSDNVHYVAMQPPGQAPVVVLGETRAVEGVDFISLALRPESSARGETPWGFFPRRLALDGLTEEQLRGVPCVILDNVGRLSASELELLRAHASSGGRFLIALGDRVDIRYYNEKLLPALLPARLVGIEETTGRDDSYFTLTASIPSHPVLRSFGVSRGEPVSEARFLRLVRAEVTDGGRVVAEFSEGLPAIIEAEGGLLFTSSFEPGWSDFVASGAFPALLHEMTRYLSGERSLVGRNFRPGDILEEEIPASHEAIVSLVGPGGRDVALSKRRLGASVLLRSAPVQEPGLYELRFGDQRAGTFSVNVSPSESALDAIAKKELLGLFRGASVVEGDATAESIAAGRSGQELWPFFLLLSLGFMVAELLVARSAVPPD